MPDFRRALVTGGAGFIGSHLTHQLIQQGWKVTVLDDLSTGLRSNLQPSPSLRFIRGSVLNAAHVIEAMRGVDTVFHLAAQVSVPLSRQQPEMCFHLNTTGTLNVLEAARRMRVQRFVYSSSAARYGESQELPKTERLAPHPTSVYGASKLAGEQLVSAYARSFGLNTVSLIYFNVFGPKQRADSPYAAVIPIFISRLLHNQPITIYGDGEQTRDFTYVSNVVDANLLAANSSELNGEAINVAGGESISLKRLVDAIAEILDIEPRTVFAPPRIGDIKFSSADISRAKQLIGYEPRIDWRQGLQLTVESLRHIRDKA